MSALVKKEIRLLLPSWIVAMLLALPPICTRSDDGIPISLLFLGMAMVALTSFGRETSLNTFSSLLAQPAERTRIWKIKLSVLAAAFLVIFAVWRLAIIFSFKDYGGREADPEASAAVLVAGGLVLVSTFTGGLWATLLLRQIAGAFWLALLTPAVLAGFTAAFLAENYSNRAVIAVLCIVLGAYSVGGFLFARWLFFRAQDVGWTGGIISLPRWKLFAAGSDAANSLRRRKPIFALLKKEFQLQQVSLLGAAGLLLLHVGIIVLRSNHKFARESAGEIITSIFWILWLVLPVMVGAMAVAEERRLGVMEGQLCQPVSRRVQFAIKGFLTLFLGTLLGGVLPMILEAYANNMIFKPADHSGEHGVLLMVLAIVGLSAWLALVSFFASSLAKNFLQAIGYAIATFIASVLLGSALINGRMFFVDYIPAHSVLPVIVAIPTILIALPWLAYLNFKNFRDDWSSWRRNLLGLAGTAAFIVVMSTALYNRAWEFFEPAEPAHGATKLSLANPPGLRGQLSDNFSVRLPDGRVWFDHLRYDIFDDSKRMRQLWRSLVDPLPRSAGVKQFIAGSNWVSVATRHIDYQKDKFHVAGYLDTVGIKADGTLWISATSKNGAWTADRMSQFGDQMDWRQANRTRSQVLLLKNDGTLWVWGTNQINNWTNWSQNWPSVRDTQPRQIDLGSDWKELFEGWKSLAQKIDGSVWGIGWNEKIGKWETHREINLDNVSLQTLSLGGNQMAYVRPDGTLWARWYEQNSNFDTGLVQVGMQTNWHAVAISWSKMVALKSDGSLWEWPFHRRWRNLSAKDFAQVLNKPPTRLGIHNDWVAMTGSWGEVIALAADGSLWLWPDREQYEDQTLLKLPKQPKLLGNVLAGEH